ncbi:hypothetical protein [Stutzerimonas nitrititolerans]|uniref:hypothetical protein n=1 Tax=Stutzerimonas nitrititolerans TaxID=2482751 RepID=UPI00289F7940|nr:hypothetical protein [Stutzerimonas nitrititolerans]
MFDTPQVTSTEIDQLRIAKLPVTTANLIYKAFCMQEECEARSLLEHAFSHLFTTDIKYNPCPGIVYRFEVETRNLEDPRIFSVSIYNEAKKACLYHAHLNKQGLDILSGT